MLTGDWTPATWSAFSVILGSCLIALMLTIAAVKTVRGWTAPAGSTSLSRAGTRPAAPTTPRLRPTVELATRRAPAALLPYDLTGELAQVVAQESGCRSIPDGGWHCEPYACTAPDDCPIPPIEWDDEARAHLAPGAGSLATIAQTHSPMKTSKELAAELDAWVHQDAAALDALMSRIMENFRVAVEPAMRKARLWELRGQEGGPGAAWARVELDHWRMESATGEIPRLVDAEPDARSLSAARYAPLRELAY